MRYVFHTFYWKSKSDDFLPKAKAGYSYSFDHVALLYNRLAKTMKSNFILNLYSDSLSSSKSYSPAFENLKVHELWDDFKEYGGCYRRLALPKYVKIDDNNINVMIDLDIIPLRGFEKLFDNNQMKFYHVFRNGKFHLNCGLYQFKFNELNEVYKHFITDPQMRIYNKKYEGSDQGIMRTFLNDSAGILTLNDKIVELKELKRFRLLPKGFLCISCHGAFDIDSLKLRVKYPFLNFV